MMQRKRAVRFFILFYNVMLKGLILSAIFVLAACAVGPDFHSPQPKTPKQYTAGHLPHRTTNTANTGQSGKTQYFVNGYDLPAEWWRLFHSPALNALIQQGLAHSPTLAAAQASLKEAQDTLSAKIGTTLFPQISAQFVPTRQRANLSSLGVSDISGSSIYNLYNTNVGVSYLLDVWGGARRQVEAARAQVDYQQYEFIGTYLSLTSNIATTAITVASYQAQVDATRDLIKAEDELLRITQQQYRLGAVSETDVFTQTNQVAQTRALLPPLEKSLAQAKHALAVLVGEYPDQASFNNLRLNDLVLPVHLPVSLPSTLVRQRPDILASEALLHVASANIGVATANLLPQFNLNATYGWTASTANTIFSASSIAWTLGAQLAQPLFKGGALLAQHRAAVDAYQQAAAQYKQTVLQAFRNVADSLRAIQQDALELKAQKQAETAALKTFVMSRQQYRLGGINYLTVLNAQQQYQQARVNRIIAQAARYSDTVALFQSLGGGWWNRIVLPSPYTTTTHQQTTMLQTRQAMNGDA